jgi:LCP family protein required for cell wall assembly
MTAEGNGPPPEDRSTPPPEDGAPPEQPPAEAGPPPSTYAGRRLQEPEGSDHWLDEEIESALPPAPEPAAPEPAASEPAPEPAAPEPAAPEPEAPEPSQAPAIAASSETVEVDTLAIADREEAQEAALAGLRARTAAQATKTEQRVAAATSPPSTAPSPSEPAAAPAAATVPPAVAQVPPPTAPGDGPPLAGAGEPPKRGAWWRFLAASVVIIVAAATATAVSGLVFGYNLASGLGGIRGVDHLLQGATSGPQTILVLGADKRHGETDHGRSDTTILLRVTSSGIRMLSIPRDLKVDNIPGHGGPWKMNAAYTFGGPKLTTEVVKRLTGLQINHVLNIDFTGFADAVNSIGCVYFDVDHDYFHSNTGLAFADQYAAIDIHAGYQRMCGYNALQFVRYRHDDSDLVRSARQQAFLREARRQEPATKILGDFNQLTNIVSKYTSTDNALTDFPTLESLAKLFVSAGGAPVTQIHFPAILGGPTDPYVTAHQTAVHAVVREFLGESNSAPSGSLGPGSGGSSNSAKRAPTGGTKAGGKGSGKKGGSSGSGGSAPAPPPPPPFTDSTAQAQQYAAKLTAQRHGRWRRQGKIPMLYPTKLVPGSYIAADSDAYPIDGPGSDVFDGYTFVAEIPAGTAGYGYSAYYDFTGTNWPDPPILDSPTETKVINGDSYELFWDNGRLRLVGWKTPNGSYWVDNDLLETLTPGQMVGMAEAMRNSKG